MINRLGEAVVRNRKPTSVALAALAVLAVSTSAPPAVGAATSALVVRVGGPSSLNAPKIAVVGSAADLAGHAFKVVDAGGHVVLRGTLRRAVGDPAPFAHAEFAELSSVRAAGSYRVVVGSVSSRRWVVRRHGTLSWVSATLNLFRANADGREPSPYHGPAHLNDRNARVIGGPADGKHFDLRGGWLDAGDQVKSTGGIAYAVLQLLEAARVDPEHRAAIRSVAAVGVRYLLRAHPAPKVFVGQVGDADVDHNTNAGPADHVRKGVSPIFRRPELDDTRTVDVYGNSVSARIRHRVAHATTDASVAGKVAAALAVAARGSSRRATLLAAARDWYDFGRAHLHDPRPANSNIIYSGDRQAVDDLGTAAAARYETSGAPRQLSQALGYLGASDVGSGPDGSSTDPFGEAELCAALGGRVPPGSRTDPSTPLGKACELLGTAAGISRDRGNANAFGSPAEFIWGSTCRNAADGAIALFGGSVRAGLTRRAAGRVASRGRDYLFGDNPWGRRFLVSAYPGVRYPHHWVETRAAGRPIGTLVGGPAAPGQFVGSGIAVPHGRFDSTTAAYADRMLDYVNNEPSIECQASGVLLLALLDG